MSQLLFQTEKVEDGRTGTSQILSNIDVCKGVASFLGTTLGPFGRDKLFYGEKLVLTNDGATILESMKYKHPVARLLVEVSKTQDSDVGDSTTSVVILASEILCALSPLIRENYSIEVITESIQELRTECLEFLKSLSIPFKDENVLKMAETCLNSKNIRNEKSHFARLLVDGLGDGGDVYINKVPGGALRDSTLVHGIAFEKTFTYAGYDQQPKRIENPKICCLNVELEWKSERENAEVRVESVEEYKKVVDAEWEIITGKLDDVVKMGSNVVLSALPIGDYATQYFAARGIFSAGRVHNLERITKTFGGRVSNSTAYAELGKCELFEERKLGGVRCNYFEGERARAHTLLLRGPGAEALEEVERAIHDAMCVIKVALETKEMVTGGGSVEMELSGKCRELALKCRDEKLFIYQAVSRAFEKIPIQLAKNIGHDPLLVVQQLRRAHSTSRHAGVGRSGVEDMLALGVLEPLRVKSSMVKAAFNLVETILNIDSTIISKK